MPNYQITVSPNPNRGTFNVSLFGIGTCSGWKCPRHERQATAGQRIAGNNTPVTVPNLAAGMYILVFYDTDNNHLIIDRQKNRESLDDERPHAFAYGPVTETGFQVI